MNRRSRSNHRSTEPPFLKFLKPGALAQIRDSRLSTARSHRLLSLLQIRASSSSPPSVAGQPSVNALMDGLPCFSGRIYGPRCPQRKKLVAAKSALFPSHNPSSPVRDAPEPLIDVFGAADILAVQ